MKKFQYIQFNIEGFTANLILNRPEVHNAMNAELMSELIAALHEVNRNPEIRLIVLKGNGPSFSSGADLNYMKESGSLSYSENLSDANRLAELFRLLYTSELPVAAFIHGQIAGGANGLVAASDYVVASEDTQFRFSEVLLGLVPATIAPYVLRKIGLSRASELMMSGRIFSVDEALDFSLINKKVPADTLEYEQKTFVGQIVKAAPGAVKKTKKLLRDIDRQPLNDEVISKTSALIAEARSSEEGKEGLSAFLEKRKPSWNQK